MSRLIDADALICEALTEACFDSRTEDVFLDLIDAQPTIDAEPVRHGRWEDSLVRDWRCSECGEKIEKVRKVDGYCYDDKPNYCPNCGVKMDGGVSNEGQSQGRVCRNTAMLPM